VKDWLPYELHTHTYHSDGKQSLRELARAARELGLRGIALTDHNTMAGLMEREAVMAETGLDIIRGLEWTTFFGHMLALGLAEYVDWRNTSAFHLHRGIRGVHEQGGIVGVAHPFRIGSPMCTGCFWEFAVSDWNDVDYIEVWSGTFPSIQNNNARAFAMWTALLNQGYRIAATCGRDWHSPEPAKEPVAATFLGLRLQAGDEAHAAAAASGRDRAALDALKRGAVSVSMGPLLLLAVRDPATGREWSLGDGVDAAACAGSLKARVTVDLSARQGHWELPGQTLEVRLASNMGELAVLKLALPPNPAEGAAGGAAEMPTDAVRRTAPAIRREPPERSADWTLAPGSVLTAEHPLDAAGLKWLRAELFGTFCGVRTMIAFTNAIYFGE